MKNEWPKKSSFFIFVLTDYKVIRYYFLTTDN